MKNQYLSYSCNKLELIQSVREEKLSFLSNTKLNGSKIVTRTTNAAKMLPNCKEKKFLVFERISALKCTLQN